jgi:hypothetical protein
MLGGAWIMVDSENSTSLSSVSRRKMLGCAIASPALRAVHLTAGPTQPYDPVLLLWCEWQRLHAYALELCKHWQKVEARLVHSVGFPQVFISSSDSARKICAQSHSDIDHAVAAGDCSQELSVALHAELAVRRDRWDAEAKALGLDEANRQEVAAWREEEEAVRAVFRTRAATLAGVEIKLTLMIELCAAFSDDPDFPLPQLRSALSDVKRLRCTLDALRC